MAITIELDSLGARVVDTAGPSGDPVILKTSVSITNPSRKRLACADSATTTIGFDGISAKVLVIVTTGALTLKLNGELTGRVINGLFVWVDTGASIASATLTNASGGALVATVLLGG